MGDCDHKPTPFRFVVVKNYPPRGPLHQYRLKNSATFTCCRCGRDKVSKLVVAVNDKWEFLLCNGCYGLLLSVWTIKAGILDDPERITDLASVLQRLIAEAEVDRARSAIIDRDSRATRISASALTLLATAEAVADGFTLKMPTDLDWSAAVIGLCKAVELETIRLIGEPLQRATTGMDLTIDLRDRNLSRMARFCSGRGNIELGSFAHFMATALRSPRPTTSPVISALRSISLRWPRSVWLFEENGFSAEIQNLTRQYRNPAAHTTLLTEDDYRSCAKLVQGADGILWRLLAAIDPTKR